MPGAVVAPRVDGMDTQETQDLPAFTFLTADPADGDAEGAVEDTDAAFCRLDGSC